MILLSALPYQDLYVVQLDGIAINNLLQTIQPVRRGFTLAGTVLLPQIRDELFLLGYDLQALSSNRYES